MERQGLLDFSSYVAERTNKFVSRQWALDAVYEWLESEDGPHFLLIIGAPGSGKTALAGRLVELSQSPAQTSSPMFKNAAAPAPAGVLDAWHFCSAREDRWRDPKTFAESLGSQLARRHEGFARLLAERASSQISIQASASAQSNNGIIAAIYIERLIVKAETPAEAFRDTVREPLEALFKVQPDTRIVLLVDALDEATQFHVGELSGIAGLLSRLAEMPRGVRVIVTTRPDDRILRAFRRLAPRPREIRLSDGPGLARSADDVTARVNLWLAERPKGSCQLVGGVTPMAMAAHIAKRAKGNFLYVRLLLDMLGAKGATIGPPQLEAIPSGLDDLYVEYLERLGGRKDKLKRVLAALAVAREPLSDQQVASFARLRPAEANNLLIALHPLLAPELARDRHALYHQSFAEVLLDRERAREFWCDPAEAHARVLSAYRASRARGGHIEWESVDDYGLRHLPYHASRATLEREGSRSPAAAGAEVITPSYVRAAVDRFGTLGVLLNTLAVLLDDALDHNDLAVAIHAAWAHSALRDRTAVEARPELVPLYVAAGKTREVKDMIAALSRDYEGSSWDHLSTQVALVRALARHGHGDEALRLAAETEERSRAWMRGAALASLAGADPGTAAAHALKIITEEGGKAIPERERAELCGALAAYDLQVDAALALAAGSGICVAAVGRALAARDTDRALSIAPLGVHYQDPLSGDEWRSAGDDVRAAVIETLAVSDIPEAEVVLRLCGSARGYHRGLIRLVAVGARHDPQTAMEVLRRSATRRNPDDDGPSDGMHRRGFRLSNIAHGLALAHVAASPRADMIIVSQAQEIWRLSREDLFPVVSEGLLFDAVDGPALGQSAVSCEILLGCALAVGTEMAEPEGIEHSADYIALQRVAWALANIDVTNAIAFVDRVSSAHPSDGGLRGIALEDVVGVIAVTDIAMAEKFLVDNIPGPTAHSAYLKAVRLLAGIDMKRAIAFAEATPARFAISRVAALGEIGALLAPGDTTAARALLARVPGYGESDTFNAALSRIEVTVATELKARQVTGAALQKEEARLLKRVTESTDRQTWLYPDELARAVGRLDPTCLEAVAADPSLIDARPMLMFLAARQAVESSARKRLALEALTVSAEASGRSAKSILAHVSLLLADVEPLKALAAAMVAGARHGPGPSWPVLQRVMETMLSMGRQPRELGAFLLALPGGSGIGALESSIATQRGLLGDAWCVLLDICDPDKLNEIVELAESLAFREMVEMWSRAIRTPNPVLLEWGRLTGLAQRRLGLAAGRAARENPEFALLQWRKAVRKDTPWESLGPVLTGAMLGLARRDLDAVVAAAADFDRLPPERVGTTVFKALDETAAVLVSTNWQRALRVSAAVSEDLSQSYTIQRIAWVAANDPAAQAAARDETFWLQLLEQADAITTHSYRESLYDTLFDALTVASPPLAVVRRVLRDLAQGDRHTCLEHLHRVVALACAVEPKLVCQLVAEPERVRALVCA